MNAPVRRATTGHRWAVSTAVAGTVVIALGAFWLSFTALADLAQRSGIGAGQAWAWPLIVDGIIVVATVAVVALAGQRAAWYPWALLIGGAAISVTANAIHAIVAADSDVPAVLAAAVASVPPVVLLSITHLTVVLIQHTTPTTGTRAPSPVAGSSQPPTEPVLPEPSAPEHASLPTTEAAPEPTQSAEPVTSIAGGGDPESPPADSRDANGVVDRRTQAARLRDEGWSNKQIARELAVHPSTVGRWFTATDPPEASDPEKQNEQTSEKEKLS
ncbi:DUF2637 domain-containing protein [Nesterenkonia ebinurensis]|uniref:DUF2637 domain-containing protein n=1 Tax=Nesterenkonia ebinurensis TaxID=2608252 RepID=UPI00123C9B4E|nr:DUF2637 domain-containing protein [Nesterenkonia ebinurensis]